MVPVCLRTKSGIPELVEDGVTGLVVEDRGGGFVDAIRSLKEDTRLWNKLSVAARERVVKEYSIQDCAEQWSDLLHALHEEVGAAKEIALPKRFSLPPVDPDLAAEDPRRVPTSLSKRFYLNGRKFAGFMKRKIVRDL